MAEKVYDRRKDTENQELKKKKPNQSPGTATNTSSGKIKGDPPCHRHGKAAWRQCLSARTQAVASGEKKIDVPIAERKVSGPQEKAGCCQPPSSPSRGRQSLGETRFSPPF